MPGVLYLWPHVHIPIHFVVPKLNVQWRSDGQGYDLRRAFSRSPPADAESEGGGCNGSNMAQFTSDPIGLDPRL